MVVVVGIDLIRQGEFRVMKLIARVEEEDVTMMRVAMIVHLAAMITTPEKIVINLRGVPGTRRDKRLSCSSSSMRGCSYYSSLLVCATAVHDARSLAVLLPPAQSIFIQNAPGRPLLYQRMRTRRT